MIARTGIIAASAALAPAHRGGDSFGRMRLRRGGGPFGRLILCARFREITRRRMVVRRLRRGTCLSGFRVLLFGRRGFERGGEKLFAGNQRGNEERPGKETEASASCRCCIKSRLQDLPLLFERSG